MFLLEHYTDRNHRFLLYNTCYSKHPNKNHSKSALTWKDFIIIWHCVCQPADGGLRGGIVIVYVCESRASFFGFQNILTKTVANSWNGKYNDDLSCMTFCSL